MSERAPLYSSPETDGLEDSNAIAEIRIDETVAGGGEFDGYVAKWVTSLLRGRSYDNDEGVSREMVQGYGKEHIREVLGYIEKLDVAKGGSRFLELHERLQMGLYLAGFSDPEISSIYPDTEWHQIRSVRNNFATLLTRKRGANDSDELIQMVSDEALEAITLDRAQARGRLQQKNAEGDFYAPFAEEFEAYSAADILHDLGQRYVQMRKLSPEDHELLSRHFLDTNKEQTRDDRYRISSAMHDLRGRFHYKTTMQPVSPLRPQLRECVEFLGFLLGSNQGESRRLPQSREAFTRKFIASSTLAKPEIDAVIARDTKKLDIAFTWLFTPSKPADSRPAVFDDTEE